MTVGLAVDGTTDRVVTTGGLVGVTVVLVAVGLVAVGCTEGVALTVGLVVVG